MTPLAGLGTIQVADSVVEFSESGERVKLVGVDGANEKKKANGHNNYENQTGFIPTSVNIIGFDKKKRRKKGVSPSSSRR